MCTILNSQVYAEWAVAIGTFLLAVVTFVMHLLGDSYTRLIKNNMALSFKRQAFNFLNLSFSLWRPRDSSPTNPQITVDQNIDRFSRTLIENQIYLSYCDKKRFNKYVTLAREYADAWNDWPNNGNEVNRLQRSILQEMMVLAPEIGEENQIQTLRNENPGLF